ncbi:MAG: hypothetical protein IJ648_01885 [Lachnospiraceae bacterium]|nr:hypothetical protein [Lachnospiraceae bacterium]MBR1567689.1 hypothetical protein [Lachnospiraceae bacterium]
MPVSIADYYSDYYTNNASSASNNVKTSALESKLNGLSADSADDAKLMEACKEFETYLVEQVVKQVKETMLDEEEDSTGYMKVFGDTMVQDISSTISDSSDLGIAQRLFESMKRNSGAASIPTVEELTEELDQTAAAKDQGLSQAETETVAENLVVQRSQTDAAGADTAQAENQKVESVLASKRAGI